MEFTIVIKNEPFTSGELSNLKETPDYCIYLNGTFIAHFKNLTDAEDVSENIALALLQPLSIIHKENIPQKLLK